MSSLVATHYPFANFPSGAGTVLTSALEVTISPALGDAGTGSVVLANDDPMLAAIDTGDIIAVDAVGSDAVPHRAFAFIVDDPEYVVIDQAEEAGQRATVTGPGHLAILNDGVIEPAGGPGRSPTVVDFIYDFTHPDFDDSGWSNATEIVSVEAAKNYYTPFTTDLVTPGVWPIPWAQDMPAHAIAGVGSGTTMIIWASDGTTTTAGIGDCPYREKFTTGYDGLHAVYLTADNLGSIYIDGKEIAVAGGGQGGPSGADAIGNGSGTDALAGGFTQTATALVSLSAGEHTVAIKGTNWPGFGGGTNPGGVAGAIYIPGYPPTLVWETTGSMKMLEYVPEWPGMSMGTVFLLMLAQHAGTFGGYVTPTFDDVDDTDSNAWDPIAQLAARAGYDSDYSLALKIMSTYADVWMDPAGWDLNAVNWGTRNPASGVTLEVGNLTTLRYKRQRKIADELMVLWSGGFTRVGSGDIQKFLELGPEDTPEEVARVAGRALGVYGNPLEMATVAYEARDDTEIPFVNANYVPGSTLTIPARLGGTMTERVPQMTLTFTKDAERIIVALVVKDLVLQAQERILNAIKDR